MREALEALRKSLMAAASEVQDLLDEEEFSESEAEDVLADLETRLEKVREETDTAWRSLDVRKPSR